MHVQNSSIILVFCPQSHCIYVFSFLTDINIASEPKNRAGSTTKSTAQTRYYALQLNLQIQSSALLDDGTSRAHHLSPDSVRICYQPTYIMCSDYSSLY